MPTVREIMTPGAGYATTADTVTRLAVRLAAGAGPIPVCHPDGRPAAMVTDRDIVVRVVAAGKDPKTTVLSDLVTPGGVATVGIDDPVEAAIATMKKHRVRRLPVVDGHRVVGLVSRADVARALAPGLVDDLVPAVTA